MTRKLPSKGHLLIVHWLDIHTDDGWQAPDTPLPLAKCRTAGFVCAVDDVSVTLAACVGVDPTGVPGSRAEVNMRMAIPWGCVTSWERLNYAGQKTKKEVP